ncbi:flagellar biosynthetic protein FliQ [uncultured Thioclava sp.]|jgi:flagellar biosynthetic protein FliQ|uniref:Flagellar biosynthetic protein FliQ n=1 Tax=Thioclava arctica TaxID=3238301 RepID=A0ABV3TR82_9RHOB|nr:flagellar biosynthetic protein FliQ [uncultured Thioclava sp.]
MTVPDWFSLGAVNTFLAIAGPALATCLLLGVGGAILQTTTQVREAALGFVPKVIGLLVLVALGGGMMLRFAENYTTHVFQSIPEIVHAHASR